MHALLSSIFWGSIHSVSCFSFLHTKHQDVLDQLASGKLDDKITSCLEKAVNELAPKYKENA